MCIMSTQCFENDNVVNNKTCRGNKYIKLVHQEGNQDLVLLPFIYSFLK